MAVMPVLPQDISENILQLLTCQDICNLAQSCKQFWAMSCQQRSIEIRACPDLLALYKAKSLLKYVQKRGAHGLQLQVLTIILNGTLSVPLFVVVAELIRACSEFPKRLSLHNAVYEWFDPPKGLLSAIIMECKRLACLTITIPPSKTSYFHRDLVLEFLLQEVVPALPQLNALHVMPFTVLAQAKLFEDGFVHSHGATQGPGLRLCAMQCNTSPLPASLRYLFIGNRASVTKELGLGWGHLSHLEELYFGGLKPEQLPCLLQHGLPAVRQSLRALVLDFSNSMLVREHALPVLDLPRLQFLAMPNAQPFILARNAVLPALQLRCPQLTVFACQITIVQDAVFLQYLVREGAPHLQTLQVSFHCAVLESYGAMWHALMGAHCLQNLNVILREALISDGSHISDIEGNQVKDMLEAALEINGLTLPELAKFNIYMRKITSLNISDLGDPVAGLLVGVPFKGASAIAVTLRDLVAEGVLPALAQVGMHPAVRRVPRGSARFRRERVKFYGPLPHMVSMPQVKWDAIAQPGHMLEHPDWTGPDQDMLQRALCVMCRCKFLDETLGTWNYNEPFPAHDSAISYVDLEGG